MKITHTSSWYFPDTSGGVEVYINNLIEQLEKYDIKSIVAASYRGEEERNYSHNTVDVYRYPLFTNPSPSQMRQQTPHQGFEYFANWLREHKGDIYHQHSWRFGCGVHHLAEARRLGMPTVVTVHLPETVCLRGTMMRGGIEGCDGLIDEIVCGRCIGVPKRTANGVIPLLASLPVSVAMAAEARLLKSEDVWWRQLGRAVGIPSLVRQHRQLLRQMAQLANRIVVVSQWQYDAFLLNGVPPEKLVLCRLGTSVTPAPRVSKPSDGVLKIGFLGRWQDTKGGQVLAAAICSLPPEIPVEVTFHGMVQGPADQANLEQVLAMAAKDRRLRVAQKLSRSEVPAAVAGFDLLAVPSQGMETGPLVVLEAFALGVPVIGSNLGGVGELIRHGVNGWLVPATDVSAWVEAICYLATHPVVVSGLRQGVGPVRSMQDVAADMVLVYESILGF